MSPAQRLRDILENIDAILQFIGNLDFPRFMHNLCCRTRSRDYLGGIHLEPLKRIAIAEFNALAQHD